MVSAINKLQSPQIISPFITLEKEFIDLMLNTEINNQKLHLKLSSIKSFAAFGIMLLVNNLARRSFRRLEQPYPDFIFSAILATGFMCVFIKTIEHGVRLADIASEIGFKRVYSCKPSFQHWIIPIEKIIKELSQLEIPHSGNREVDQARKRFYKDLFDLFRHKDQISPHQFSQEFFNIIWGQNNSFQPLYNAYLKNKI